MEENFRLRAIKTFYSGRDGLVTLEDDVLSIVSQVKQDYGDKITVEVDPDTGQFLFIEHCEDHTDRLIFSTDELDGRALDRLRRADAQYRGHEDPYAAAEREQDEAQRRIDQAHTERILETGEELLFALKKDGRAPRMPTQVFIPAGVRSLDA